MHRPTFQFHHVRTLRRHQLLSRKPTILSNPFSSHLRSLATLQVPSRPAQYPHPNFYQSMNPSHLTITVPIPSCPLVFTRLIRHSSRINLGHLSHYHQAAAIILTSCNHRLEKKIHLVTFILIGILLIPVTWTKT